MPRAPGPFVAAAFSGAGLLFAVEPMLAKWLLPAVGGTPATWAACMLFFQGLLLAGYVYSHLTTRFLERRAQLRVHAVIVFAAASFALGARFTRTPELGATHAELAIPWLLAKRVGLPFFVLASTLPLIQSWASDAEGKTPFWLYAVSNAGSLLGLIAYPFFIEPAFEVGAELRGWAIGFVLFAALMLLVLVSARRGQKPSLPPSSSSAFGRGRRVRWLIWSFVPSAMLLGATNEITLDLSAVPLLWVLPLAAYLCSFIIAFSFWHARFRSLVLAGFCLGALGIAVNAFVQAKAPFASLIGAPLLALACASLLCHGELAFERPDARELTRFYVLIALGGALGGVFVAWIAPLVFSDYYELALTTLVVFLILIDASRAWPRTQRLLVLFATSLCVPMLGSTLIVKMQSSTRQGRLLERQRSFFGVLKVVENEEGRIFTHGRIQHGMQLSDPASRRTPTMYFGPGTALERVLGVGDGPARRIGIVGLGVGTIAAYGRAGDTLRFYELDRDVVNIAERDFSFLRDSTARVEIAVGDGRLALAREPAHDFDVLVLDAFTSDAVPVHLLTREAFAIYARQLRTGGLMLANVSNRYLAVERVVRASARANGFECAIVETPSDATRHVSHALWAVIAKDPRVFEAFPNSTRVGPEAPWTDARASLWSIVR